VGFVADKLALGQVFSEYIGFPCQFLFQVAPQSPLSIIWCCYNRPVMAAIPSELSLTPLRIKKSDWETLVARINVENAVTGG
jgi:hypothetical protein